MQIVITYEYESAGLDQLVFGGRASATHFGPRIGGTFFTEEGQGDGRFTVGGFDLDQRLPRNGRLRFELPYSTGTPSVESSVDSRPVDLMRGSSGFAAQAEVEQPFAFWNGVARGAYLQADKDFRNPFSATITPGATYASRFGRTVSVHEFPPPLRRHVRARRRVEHRRAALDASPVNGRNRSVAV